MSDARDDELDQVEQDIETAEEDAEQDLGPRDEPRYADSGDIRPDLDDQTITPPG